MACIGCGRYPMLAGPRVEVLGSSHYRSPYALAGGGSGLGGPFANWLYRVLCQKPSKLKPVQNFCLRQSATMAPAQPAYIEHPYESLQPPSSAMSEPIAKKMVAEAIASTGSQGNLPQPITKPNYVLPPVTGSKLPEVPLPSAPIAPITMPVSTTSPALTTKSPDQLVAAVTKFDLHGLMVSISPDDTYVLSGKNIWGEAINDTYYGKSYFLNAIPVLKNYVTPEQAKDLEALAVKLSGASTGTAPSATSLLTQKLATSGTLGGAIGLGLGDNRPSQVARAIQAASSVIPGRRLVVTPTPVGIDAIQAGRPAAFDRGLRNPAEAWHRDRGAAMSGLTVPAVGIPSSAPYGARDNYGQAIKRQVLSAFASAGTRLQAFRQAPRPYARSPYRSSAKSIYGKR